MASMFDRETHGLVFEGNTIRDTRDGAAQTQTTGVLIEPQVGEVTLRDNQIDAKNQVDDQRGSPPRLAEEKSHE